MPRALFLASLVLVGSHAAWGQALSILHIKVAVIDAERGATPVPRHVLLVSDNPASGPPRRIVTAQDGTVDVKLLPGNYTVESDRPVAFNGKVYQWTQIVDIAAGRDAVLELTADNADAAPTASETAISMPLLPEDPAFLLPRWQESVVAIWTPSSYASGFVFDARGLIATSQRGIGTATAIEVQLTPEVKVAARVLESDAARDVAIFWIDPKIVASVQPVPMECAQAVKPPIVEGQELFTIGAPLREPKGMTSGEVRRLDSRSVVSDFRLAPGSAGGPVFTVGGALVGITSVVDGSAQGERETVRVVRVDDACTVVASAEKKMKEAAAPDPTHLPVDPLIPFPTNALKDAAERRAGGVSPLQMSSSDFDVTFLTPLHIDAAQEDFSNWSEYVAGVPPVLMVRVTPKLAEGFWTKVARGAAYTQGVSLPPIKRLKSGFSRMRAFCGETAVTPIHPFTLERRVSETDAINEGLYVFDPGALGPHCGTVKLVFYSEKEPEKGDDRVVDPKLLQTIWQLFAPYRALQGAAPPPR